MKTVWAVEQGSYSDYHVVGVFTTKENAEMIIAAMTDEYDKPTIAEWELDPAVGALNAGLKRFSLVMLRDGTVERVDEQEFSAYDLEGKHWIWERTKALAYQGKGIPDALQSQVWAVDSEHAIKIANEKRAQMIAAGEWQ